MLPPFWIPWLIILGICTVVALAEVPEDMPSRKQLPPRYLLAVEYAGRIIVLGVLCGWARFILWALS